MAKITGIGGVFFRAKDPGALSDWYKTHLGVHGPDPMPWTQEEGFTVFAPFAQDSDYFSSDKQWMINLRVDDLDGLSQSLQAAGIEVHTDPSWDTPEIGRFARIHDPEGNPIELWEPAAPPE